MSWLASILLGSRLEPGTDLVGAKLHFQGGLGVGWLLLGILALGLWTYGCYRLSPAHLARWKRNVLIALRCVVFILLLGLLLRPAISLTVEGSVRRLLVVLLDTSTSMRIKDPRTTEEDRKRVALAKDLLDPGKGLKQPFTPGAGSAVDPVARLDVLKNVLSNRRLNLLPRLAKDFDIAIYGFGQHLTDLSSLAANTATNTAAAGPPDAGLAAFQSLQELNAGSPATALGDALREVINRKRGQPLAGVVVATDGANNSGSAPLETAAVLRDGRVPAYTYGVGITSPRDIIVASLLAPEVTFLNDELTLNVRIRSTGLEGEIGKLVVKLGDETVEQDVALSSGGEQVVSVLLTPKAEGEFEIEASIDPRHDEAVPDNNKVSQRVRVVDARIRVLLVDQGPRWEFRYLQAMLLRDRRIDLKCYLAEGSPALARDEQSPYISHFPARKEELFSYDVVIFGDLNPKVFSASNEENLNELVSKFGGAVIFVAGRRYMPHAYKRSVIERLLPVEFEGTSVEPTHHVGDRPIKFELTAAGRASPMMRLAEKPEESLTLWQQMPPVYWVARVTRAKPAAEVLLADPDPARESRFGKMPVLAHHQYGLGQVMFVGTDNTWRWRKNAGDVYYTALWGQAIQRLALQRLLGGSKRTQLTTDKQNYITGDRVSLYARLYTPSFEPVQEPSVAGHFQVKGGTGTPSEVILRPVPDQAGLYRGEFLAGAPGSYGFGVESDPETSVDFQVIEPKFELGETAMNEPLLRELARKTDGAFFREEDLDQLPETISRKTERIRSPLEVDLWSSPLYFLIILVVVAIEWVMRKFCYLK